MDTQLFLLLIIPIIGLILLFFTVWLAASTENQRTVPDPTKVRVALIFICTCYTIMQLCGYLLYLLSGPASGNPTKQLLPAIALYCILNPGGLYIALRVFKVRKATNIPPSS